MNSNIRFISLVGVIALLTAGCSSAPQQEPASTETPAATLKASEVCVLNETETPIEIVWKSANMRTDGDKKGTYAITKSNSGKVCGLGSKSGEYGQDVEVYAGNLLLAEENHVLGLPTTQLWFHDESGAQLCRGNKAHLTEYEEGDVHEFVCGATSVSITRQPDNDYKNFLLTFTSAEPFTPSSH